MYKSVVHVKFQNDDFSFIFNMFNTLIEFIVLKFQGYKAFNEIAGDLVINQNK